MLSYIYIVLSCNYDCVEKTIKGVASKFNMGKDYILFVVVEKNEGS